MDSGMEAGRRPITVRRGTPEDLPALLVLGELMHREVHFGAYSAPKVQAMIEEVLLRGVVLCTEDASGALAGTCGLIPEQAWWSEDWQLSDRWLFVRPECRREGHAGVLLRAALNTARLLKLPLLMAHIGSRAQGKARLLQRVLGEPVGAIFFVPALRREG